MIDRMLRVRFKKASKSDLKGILHVMQKVGYLDFRFPNQPIAKIQKQIELELYDRTFLICYIKCSSGKYCHDFKMIIGYSIFGPAEKFLGCPIKIKKRNFLFSLGIGIDPDYQRMKIGKKFAKYCEFVGFKSGFRGAYGDIASNNKTSLQFQKSMGFKKIAEYYDPKRPKGIKNLLFFKKINGPKRN